MEKTVSESALIRRINRRIGGYKEQTYITAWGMEPVVTHRWVWGEVLWAYAGDGRTTGRILARQGGGAVEDSRVGRYYTLDRETGDVTATHIDLEQYGREVGALADWEQLEKKTWTK